MIFWLILVITAGPTAQTTRMMHVGNFSTLAECQSAAKAAAFVGLGPTTRNFVCVQANTQGINPPN
jgi:hypothetical protein